VRFVSSGTEATMSAIRLARGVTGRDLILKFSGCYHGHADHLLVAAGSGLVTFGKPSSDGVPEAFAERTRVLPLDDPDAVQSLFDEEGDRIAAVIVEPIPANNGLLLQHTEYLEALRRSYADRVRLADQALGRLRRELEARGHWRDTLLVVTSDHGEAFFEHGLYQHDYVPFDEVMRVPWVLSFPAGLGEDEVMEAALDAGAEDVITNDDGSIDVITTPEDFAAVRDGLAAADLRTDQAEVSYNAATLAELDQETAEKLLRLVDALEDLGDVQEVYTNADIAPEILEALE